MAKESFNWSSTRTEKVSLTVCVKLLVEVINGRLSWTPQYHQVHVQVLPGCLLVGLLRLVSAF